MKKIIAYTAVFLIALALSACDSSYPATNPEDTQKKIDESGWTIQLETNKTAESIYVIDLKIDENTKITMSRYKDKKAANQISYQKKISADQYYIAYDIHDDAFYGLISNNADGSYKTTCARYNLKEKTEDDRGDDLGKCSVAEIEILSDKMEEYETIMKDHNLSYEELQAWGNWYYEHNK